MAMMPRLLFGVILRVHIAIRLLRVERRRNRVIRRTRRNGRSRKTRLPVEESKSLLYIPANGYTNHSCGTSSCPDLCRDRGVDQPALVVMHLSISRIWLVGWRTAEIVDICVFGTAVLRRHALKRRPYAQPRTGLRSTGRRVMTVG